MTHSIEPLAMSPWGWSEVVALVANPTEATATIGLFSCMRDTIGQPVSWWQAAALTLPDLRTTDWSRITAPEFAGVLMSALKPVALNPAARAAALLSLDVHIAYLRAQFDVSASEGQS